MHKAKKTLPLSTTVAIVAAVMLGWYAFAWSPDDGGLDRALALQPTGGFCQLRDAEDVLNRLGERGSVRGIKLMVANERVVPGQALQARLLNLTRGVVLYGSEFKIQRYSKSGWKTDPSSPSGPWPRRLSKLSSGGAGRCYRFVVPAQQEAGRYRFLTFVDSGPAKQRRIAEFFVSTADLN